MKNIKVAHINYSDSGGGAAIAAFRMHELGCSSKIDSIMLVDKKLTSQNDVKHFNNALSRLLRLIFDKLIKLIFLLLNGYKEQISLNILSSKKLKNIGINHKRNIIHLHWVNNEMMSIKDISEINCNKFTNELPDAKCLNPGSIRS